MFENKYMMFIVIGVVLLVLYYMYDQIEGLKKDYYPVYAKTLSIDRNVQKLNDDVSILKTLVVPPEPRPIRMVDPVYSITYDSERIKREASRTNPETKYMEIGLEEKELINRQLGGKLDQIDAPSEINLNEQMTNARSGSNSQFGINNHLSVNASDSLNNQTSLNAPVKINVDIDKVLKGRNPMLAVGVTNNLLNNQSNNLIKQDTLSDAIDDLLNTRNDNNTYMKQSLKSDSINSDEYKLISEQMSHLHDNSYVSDELSEIPEEINDSTSRRVPKGTRRNSFNSNTMSNSKTPFTKAKLSKLKRSELIKLAKTIMSRTNRNYPKKSVEMTNPDYIKYILDGHKTLSL